MKGKKGILPIPFLRKSLNRDFREIFNNMKTFTKTRAPYPIQASSVPSTARTPSKTEGREARGKEDIRQRAQAFLRMWLHPSQGPERDRSEPDCKVEWVGGREEKQQERRMMASTTKKIIVGRRRSS